MRINTETKVGLFVVAVLAVFLYVAIYLDIFRFNGGQYKSYVVHFNNASGLVKKADIKMCGVKIGWVEDVALAPQGGAHVTMMITSQCTLYTDTQPEIRQEGLLGGRYIDVIPGTPPAGLIENQAILERKGRQPVAIEDILSKMESIATNIEQISLAVKEAVCSSEQQSHLKNIVTTLDTHILPSIQDGMERVCSVAQKIDEGEGLIGKLVNDSQTYNDICYATRGLKEYFTALDDVRIIVDTHLEGMQRPAENYYNKDSKGFVDIRCYTGGDLFYLFQIVGSEAGYPVRFTGYHDYADACNRPIPFDEQRVLGCSFNLQPPNTEHEVIQRNAMRYGLQIGKMFGNGAVRAGFFESAFGFAIDYEIPLSSPHLRWISSLEFYDFRGQLRAQMRYHDRRPHFKWINRLFAFEDIYFTFGADDFVSKHNINAFFGFGMCFGDESLKYLLSKVGSFGNALGSNGIVD